MFYIHIRNDNKKSWDPFVGLLRKVSFCGCVECGDWSFGLKMGCQQNYINMELVSKLPFYK